MARPLQNPAAGHLNLNVTTIETIWVNVPLRPVPARRMLAENYDWTYFQIYKVKLACGVVGFGETMPFYTWGRLRGNPGLRAGAECGGNDVERPARRGLADGAI